jgi:hypothetical protein
MRHLGSRGKVTRCVNPCRYGCPRTQKLESRMLRKRARPVRRGEGRFGLSEIPPECSGGSEAHTVPRWPPTLPQRVRLSVWITFLMTGWSTPHRIQASKAALESKEASETIEWELWNFNKFVPIPDQKGYMKHFGSCP